jgi:hypothetical protein
VFEIGNSLREARLRQQLDFPEIEQTTKIRAKYLRALEEEKFDALPASTYVKGFLRAYADALGLDGQLYVDEYNSRFVVGEDEPPVRPRRTAAAPPLTSRVETRGVVFALVGIAVVFAFVIAAWKFASNDKQSVNGVNAAHPTLPAARTSVPQKPVRRPRPARPIRRPARLLLTAATGDCWLQVRAGSATGKLLYEGTLQTGQKLPLVRPRLWLLAGAPRNLVARLNGRLVPLPGQSVPRRLIVTPRSVSLAPAAA